MQELFDFDKTLQAVAYLLNKAKGRLSRIKLLKLLYIADREFLFQHGSSITGDTMYALEYGPVLITTYNLLKGADSQSHRWSNYVKTDKSTPGKMTSVVRSPGIDDLSRAEMLILDNVFSQFGNMSEKEIVEYTHSFEEWKFYYRPGIKTRVDSEYILRLNHHENLIPVYRENILVKKELNRLFDPCGI